MSEAARWQAEPAQPIAARASGLESLAHREAKRALLFWLREAAEQSGVHGAADFAGLSWRVNRGPQCFGIWCEYPIMADGRGASPVWDELRPQWWDCAPSYDELVAGGARPMVVLDIAVQHKGRIAFAIEIEHKHACDARKIGFLRKQDISLLQVPAYWVLGQVDRPKEIPGEFWLS